jgi:hypothetical protein
MGYRPTLQTSLPAHSRAIARSISLPSGCTRPCSSCARAAPSHSYRGVPAVLPRLFRLQQRCDTWVVTCRAQASGARRPSQASWRVVPAGACIPVGMVVPPAVHPPARRFAAVCLFVCSRFPLGQFTCSNCGTALELSSGASQPPPQPAHRTPPSKKPASAGRQGSSPAKPSTFAPIFSAAAGDKSRKRPNSDDSSAGEAAPAPSRPAQPAPPKKQKRVSPADHGGKQATLDAFFPKPKQKAPSNLSQLDPDFQ